MRMLATVLAFILAVVGTCTMGIAGSGLGVCVGLLVVVCTGAEVVHCIEQDHRAEWEVER